MSLVASKPPIQAGTDPVDPGLGASFVEIAARCATDANRRARSTRHHIQLDPCSPDLPGAIVGCGAIEEVVALVVSGACKVRRKK